MKVFFNYLPLWGDKIEWSAQNGKTRTRLVVTESHKNKGKLIVEKDRNLVYATLAYLEKGKVCLILLCEDNPQDNRIFGVFLNQDYGYTVLRGKEVFSASSVGGPANSESKMGIYEPGTLIKVFTYKHRTPPTYYLLTEEGWKYIDEASYQELFVEDVKYV